MPRLRLASQITAPSHHRIPGSHCLAELNLSNNHRLTMVDPFDFIESLAFSYKPDDDQPLQPYRLM
jgi:hypothetical protein